MAVEEEEDDRGSYFMEVFDQVRSVSLVLRGSDHPTLLELHPQMIILKKNNESCEEYPLPVTIEPESYTAIHQHLNEGIGIRLQLRDDTPEPQTGFLSTAVKRLSAELNRLESSISQCGCKACGLSLFVDNVKFNRVLPLPSQTWRDLFNNWSCCSSSLDKSKQLPPVYLAKSTFKPRENDCLLDDFNLYVHHKVIEGRNIILRPNSFKSTNKAQNHSDETKKGMTRSHCVKCARCRAELGELFSQNKQIECIKFRKSSIEILTLKSHLCDPVIRPIFFSEFFLERIIAQRLSNAVDSHSTHFYVLQDPDGNAYSLIRVMNSRSRLFVNNGKYSNGLTSTDEILQKSRRDDCGKEINTPHSFANHNGGGDCSDCCKVNCKDKLDGLILDKKGEAKNIRKDGPTRILGSNVAEVVERLFSFSTHLISIGRSCNYVNNSDPSGCERIVKVMYIAPVKGNMGSDLLSQWIKDDRTLILTYPKQICIQILLILLSSTLTLPVAYRIIDRFVIGFLRLD